jgi:ribose transport system substrate-binding protein
VKVPGTRGGSATKQRWLPLVVGVFLIAALTVGLTACGGGGSSSSSSSEEATTSEETGAAEEGGSEEGGSSELASFEKKLEAAKETEPNHWEGPTDPVTPPKKFKVAGVSCASVLEGCLTPLEGAEDAAKELGWEFEIYDGEGDPTVQAKRIQQAVQKGANALILAAVEGNSVKSALEEAEQAGVIIISTSNGTAPGEQGYEVDTSPNVTAIGNAVADWMIVDSEGKAVVTPFVDQEFQTNIDFSEGIEEELAECPGCTTEPGVNFVATDVGSKLGGNTTAYLQQHPDVEYFYSTYDPAMSEQVAAVQQAGIEVKSCSQLGDAQNLSFIKNEQVQACDGAWDNEYEGYATIDQIIRLATKKPLWVSENVPSRYKYGENIPWVLLEKENLPESEETYRAPFDYISEYQKLWGLK